MKQSLQQLKIGVLVGGISSEREISYVSGESVFKALKEEGYNAVIIDVDDTTLIDKLKDEKIEFCFNTLHGRFGEDGKIQAILEYLKIPYTGSGVHGSALAMDKEKTKLIFKATSIPTAPFLAFSPEDLKDKDYIFKFAAKNIGFPMVIKPTLEGSSIGITIIKKYEELEECVCDLFKKYTRIMVEKYIPGREFTVAVLGGEKLESLGVVEIIPKEGFYDLSNKYSKGKTDYVFPAEVPERIAKSMRENALKAHQFIGCFGYSRVDFRWDGRREPQVLEINTLPGMTELSLLPMSASVNGYNFIQLLEKMMEFSINRKKSSFYRIFSV